MADGRGYSNGVDWTRQAGARRSRTARARGSAVPRRRHGERDVVRLGRLLSARTSRFRSLSIGNLSVGGTGKTPVAAWCAQRLAAKGMKPAIVLRGYGGDETIVHRRLNPGVPVIAAADRVRGIREAIAQGVDVSRARRCVSASESCARRRHRARQRRRVVGDAATACRRVRGVSRSIAPGAPIS